MKRLLLLLFGVLLTIPAFSQDFTYEYEGQTLTYSIISLTDKTCKTKSGYYDKGDQPGNSVSGDLKIPSVAIFDGEEYTVTKIGYRSFYNCGGLTSVEIPNSVTNIDSWAFYGCWRLTSVKISDSVTEIGERAFYGCRNLPSVEFPDSLITIGVYAFYSCKTLTSIVIPNSVTTIYGDAFSQCTGLTTVTISESVTGIGGFVFSECTNLTTIYILNPLPPEIQTSTFSKVPIDSLEVHIPANSLGNYIENALWSQFKNFYIDGEAVKQLTNEGLSYYCVQSDEGNSAILVKGDYNGLTDITIPAQITDTGNPANPVTYNVTEIGGCAFKDCVSLKTVNFEGESNIEIIGEEAFSGCRSLTSIEIPQSTSSISEKAFYDCSELREIIIADSNSPLTFEKNVFGKVVMTKLYLGRNFIYYGDTNSAFQVAPFYKQTLLKELIIGDRVTEIGARAFEYCSGFTSVNIPNSVISIGAWAFSWCTGLSSIEIPNSIKSISNGAFWNCSGLKEITIDDGETILEIDESAFPNYSVTKLYWGRNIYSPGTSSETSPFQTMEVLNDVTISNSVTHLPIGAFGGCLELTNVEIPNSVTSIGAGAFSGCEKLTSVKLPESITSIGEYTFGWCPSLTSIKIPDSVTEIGYEAFFKSGLASLEIPGSVTKIGGYAFEYCSNLKEVTIKDSESILEFDNSNVFRETNISKLYLGRNIKGGVFHDKTGLRSVVIGCLVTEMNSTFWKCIMLNDVTINDSETPLMIDTGTFQDVGVNTLYLGRNITYAKTISPFYERFSLRTVIIGNAVTEIGQGAFYGCRELKNVTIEDGDKTLNFGPNAFFGTNLSTLYLGRNFTYSDSPSKAPFYNKGTLTDLTIGDSVTEFDANSFRSCSGLTSVELPSSVTAIGEYAFYECDNIEKIVSESTVAPTIAANSFSSSVRALCNVEIPEDATSSYEQKWCCFSCFATVTEENNIITVSSPGNLLNQIEIDRINDYTKLKLRGKLNGTDILTLNKCPNIMVLDLSEASIVSGGMSYYSNDNERFGTVDDTLGEMWCYNLNYLSSVKLPESLTTIGPRAFNGKSFLISVTVPPTVTSVGEGSFTGCIGLQSIELPSSVTTIGQRAFYRCSGMTSVSIQGSETRIDDYAFKGCTGLTKAEFASIEALCNIEFGSGESNPISLAHTLWIAGEEIKDLVIPATVKEIGWGTFKDCTGLTSVEIPNSVRYIDWNAFSGCSGLTTVKLPNSLQGIENYTFRGCVNLHTVNIPDPVQWIGVSAFEGCSSLKTLELPGSLREIDELAFSGCTSLESVKVINPIPPVVEGNSFSNVANISLEIPDGSRSMYWIHPYWGQFKSIGVWGSDGDNMFMADNVNYRITSEIDRTVEVAGISQKSRKAELVIPAEVESAGSLYRVTGIANNSFENSAIASVALPASIGYVGIGAFRGCSAIRMVECNAVTPPSIDAESFDEEVYSTANLHVPEESITPYKRDAVWGKFNVSSMSVLVESIELDPTSYQGMEGETFHISATVYPMDATNQTLEWSSTDEEIASVDSEGNVTVLKEGICEIIVKATDGSGVEAICRLDVSSGIEGIGAESDGLIRVYSLNGVLLLTCDDDEILKHLEKGVYIIRRGNRVKKIAVK